MKRRVEAPRESRLITVAGIEHKVGTTHFAFSLAAKAVDRNRSCGLIVSAQTFEAMNTYYALPVDCEGSKHDGGARKFARIGGITLMTGTLPGDVDGFDLLVWDCETLACGGRCFGRGDVGCLITGGQAWELPPLNAVLMETPYEELRRTVLCVRGIGEEDFLHIRKQVVSKMSCVQVPHKPDWTDNTLREDLVEVLRIVEM